MDKKWVSIELPKSYGFGVELTKMNIYYETSGCKDLLHYEILANDIEIDALNKILESL